MYALGQEGQLPIARYLKRGQRAVAKSGVHVSQREELWSSLSLYFKTDFLSGEGEMTRESAKGIYHLIGEAEESFGTDSLTSPPAADRTRASIYSTALTVTEKTGTDDLLGHSYSSERGIFAFLLATRIGKVSVVIGAGNGRGYSHYALTRRAGKIYVMSVSALIRLEGTGLREYR
ncbi:hypothetical protein VNO77_46827 [Canavalia gladiata]|uniref:Uncharacterized protein n=1 Tax=Canavalia gladiata TaxID=3824 RepID=A0AAN9PHZ7_CANGL